MGEEYEYLTGEDKMNPLLQAALDFHDAGADSHRYKQMGNAVAVPVVEFLIKRLVKLG